MSKLGRFTFMKRTFRVAVELLALGILVVILATGSAAAISSCQELNQSQTYQLENNIVKDTTKQCLEITADDLVLEGNGKEVNGVNRTADSAGIFVSDTNNVTVKNLGNVTGWDFGIVVSESNDVRLTNNTANNNGETTTSSDGAGIASGESEDVNLTGNTANNNNPNGILLAVLSSVLSDNTANSNEASGIVLGNSVRNELTGNKANGNGAFGVWLRQNSNFNNLTDNVARDNIGGEDSAGIYLGGAQSVNNNTLVNNTATGDQRYGIYLSEASDNELRENKANENNEAGIYLTQSSIGNNLTDNMANRNGLRFKNGSGIFGIWLDDGSNRNNLTGNEAFDNGPRNIEVVGGEPLYEDSVEPSQVEGPQSAGIYLDGAAGSVKKNTLIDNELRDTDTVDSSIVEGGNQAYGIWLSQAADNELIDNTANENYLYGIWLSQGSGLNELIDNVALDNGKEFTAVVSTSEEDIVEDSAGIYLGVTTGSLPPSENLLVNNTVRGSEYGMWIRNSFQNDVSETLAAMTEFDTVGIRVIDDFSA